MVAENIAISTSPPLCITLPIGLSMRFYYTTAIMSTSLAFLSAAPHLIRTSAFTSSTSSSLVNRSSSTSYTSTSTPARMQLRSLMNNMFGKGGAPTEAGKHAVLGSKIATPDQAAGDIETATFGLGCFWGAERKFWQEKGVTSTSVGYAGGATENPDYRSVCSGRTGHAEVVNVLYNSKETSYETLLDVFWDSHNPTTLNQQGNDRGTQYRSVIMYYNDEQKLKAQETKKHFNVLLKQKGYGDIVTEIVPAATYYLAEDYHQQYLEKNPGGYCGLGGIKGCYKPPARTEAEAK